MRASTNVSFDRNRDSHSGIISQGGFSFPIVGDNDECPMKDRHDRHADKAKFRDRSIG